MSLETPYTFEFHIYLSRQNCLGNHAKKIIEIEQHLLFFIDFLRVPKYRNRPIVEGFLCVWFISSV